MESPEKRSGDRTISVADGRRSGPREKQFSVSALEVADVVRYGSGPGSRIDFTIGCAGHRVRLRLPAKHVLSYGRIGKAAMQEGLVLPYDRSANRAWRKVLARAMERARVEPLLEGEEIADAVAEEIQALLEGGPRGNSASDLLAGKVVEQGGRLLVSPKALVGAVRNRLVDDVLSQATIAEAAAAHLGMRQLRHRFPDARPRAWAFPLSFAAARENREVGKFRLVEGVSSKTGEEREAPGEAHGSTERGVRAGEAERIRSMDQERTLASPLTAEGCDMDPLDRPKKTDCTLVPPMEDESGAASFKSDEMPAGSNGRRNGGPKS